LGEVRSESRDRQELVKMVRDREEQIEEIGRIDSSEKNKVSGMRIEGNWQCSAQFHSFP